MKPSAFSRQLIASSLIALAVLSGCKATRVESREHPSKPSAPTSKKKSGSGAVTRDGMLINGRAYPTGERSSSAIYLEKSVPVEVILGKAYEYRLEVTNLTNDQLDNVVVTDQPGQGFQFKSSTPAPQGSDNATLTWLLGDLGGGQKKAITVTGSAAGVTSVTGCADVSYDSMLCLTTNVVEPKLKITKEGPPEIMICDPITYKFVVTNSGTGAARNIKVEDRLPAGLATESGSNTISFTIAELGAGENKTYSAKVKAQKTGSYTNAATASADGGLSSKSNEVKTVVREPKLALTMNAPKLTYGGTPLPVQLTASNTGDATCTETLLEVTIPDGTSFERASQGGRKTGNKVQWKLGNLAAGAKTDVEMVLRADKLGGKTIDAEIICRCADAATARASTDVKGIPAILIEVVDVEDPIPVGTNVTYVVTVTNQGSAVANDIEIVCTLEDTMEYVSSSGATRGSASGNTVTFAPLKSVAPGDDATWKVIIKAKRAGDVRFRVEMNSTELGRKVEETEATNFYE